MCVFVDVVCVYMCLWCKCGSYMCVFGVNMDLMCVCGCYVCVCGVNVNICVHLLCKCGCWGVCVCGTHVGVCICTSSSTTVISLIYSSHQRFPVTIINVKQDQFSHLTSMITD